MMELLKTGAYLVNGTEIIEDTPEAQARLQAVAGPDAPSKEEAAKGTIAYGILEAHNTSDNMEKLKIRFDKLTSHDITLCRNYPDSTSIRIREVPDAICSYKLS